MPNPFARTLGLLALLAAAGSPAQTPAEFEVASVRPNTLNDRIVSIAVGPGGRFDARDYTLVLLIQRAYGVMDWNVSGGPPWIRIDRFDVSAKANIDGNLTEARSRPMLRKLLADRFKLLVHESSREMAGYALIVAKGGPKLKASADAEEHPDSFRLNRGAGLSGHGITMTNLARFVTGKLGLIGVDETGLTGLYDLKADWKVEDDQSLGGSGDDRRDADLFAVNSALQDQLGLKLIPKKVSIATIVIDSVQKASASEN